MAKVYVTYTIWKQFNVDDCLSYEEICDRVIDNSIPYDNVDIEVLEDGLMYTDKDFEAMHGGIPETTEVDKLIDLLNNCVEPIPFEVTTNQGRPQVWFPSKDNPVCDAICHWGSYGHPDGLIEIMGLTHNDDTVEGYLSAWEVFARISDYYTYHKDNLDF